MRATALVAGALVLLVAAGAWAETGGESEGEAETEAEGEAEGEGEGETEAEAEAEAEGEGEGEAKTEAEGEGETEAEGEAETEGEGETEGETEEAYDAAFAALVAGEFGAAIIGFERVAETSADPERRAAAHELARLARELSERGVRMTMTAEPEAPRVSEEDRPDAGRIQFVASTTGASLYSGIALAIIFDFDFAPEGIAFVTGVTGAGFAASLAGSRRLRLTQGIADAYSFGVLYGGANALLLQAPLEMRGDAALAFSIAGLTVGGFFGQQFARLTNPTPGQVRFNTNVAALGAASAALGAGVVQPDLSASTLSLIVSGGLNAGTVTGLMIARNLDWSRQRSDLVVLSSGLGALAGAATGLIVATSGDFAADPGARTVSASTLAGMWGGFGLGAYFTRNMKPAERFLLGAQPVTIAPLSFEEGGTGLSLAGRF